MGKRSRRWRRRRGGRLVQNVVRWLRGQRGVCIWLAGVRRSGAIVVWGIGRCVIRLVGGGSIDLALALAIWGAFATGRAHRDSELEQRQWRNLIASLVLRTPFTPQKSRLIWLQKENFQCHKANETMTGWPQNYIPRPNSASLVESFLIAYFWDHNPMTFFSVSKK